MRGELLALLPVGALLLAMTSAVDPNGSDSARRLPLLIDESTEDTDTSGQPLSAAAICGRAEHDLQDGSRTALIHARRLFDAAVRHYPNDACGHAGLARSLTSIVARGIEENDGLASAAVASARRAVDLAPKSATARAALAGALLAMLDVDAAASEATTALALEPDNLVALQTQAVVMLSTGRHRRGLELIARALDTVPGLVSSHHIKGLLKMVAGEEHDAIVAFGNALSLSPDHMPSMLALATAYEQAGDYKSSARIFEKVLIEHTEESSRCNLYMGYSLMKRYSWKAALSAFEKVSFKTRRGLSNGTVIYLRGICNEKLGRRDEAVAAFRNVIDNWPDATIGFAKPERLVSPAYEGLGRLHLAAGETEKAVLVLEEGAGRSDAGPDLLVRLANLYNDYQMTDKAIPLLERAASAGLGPRNADSVMTAYVLWSRLARRMEDRGMLDRMSHSLAARAHSLAEMNELVYDLDAMRAFSIAGRGPEALDSLRRATGAGYRQIAWIQDDPDMAALRAAPGFENLTRDLSGNKPPTD